MDRFEIFKNALPHNQENFHKRFQKWLSEHDSSFIEEKGHEFYQARREGGSQGWHSFVSGQEAGSLPKAWDDSARNIVIFNSSEDEFISVGTEWRNPVYNSQIEGVRKILEDMRESRQIYWVRMHPNLIAVPENELRPWFELESEFDNVRIIPPESTVSSYSLLDKATVVLTFGSSVGIEASYWGKPSILAGTNFYRGLNGCHECSSHLEVIEFLLNETLGLVDRLPAIQFGAFLNAFGTTFNYAQARDFGTAFFKGKSTRGKLWSSFRAWSFVELWRGAIVKDYLRFWKRRLLMLRGGRS